MIVWSSELGVRYSNNPERYLGLPNIVGQNRKASFQNINDRMKKKELNVRAQKYFPKEGKRFSLNSYFRVFLRTLWLSFCYQSPFVMNWRVLWQDSGGKKGKGNGVSIGVIGKKCLKG